MSIRLSILIILIATMLKNAIARLHVNKHIESSDITNLLWSKSSRNDFSRDHMLSVSLEGGLANSVDIRH